MAEETGGGGSGRGRRGRGASFKLPDTPPPVRLPSGPTARLPPEAPRLSAQQLFPASRARSRADDLGGSGGGAAGDSLDYARGGRAKKAPPSKGRGKR